MPKKKSKQEIAYNFRHALLSDLNQAESILREHSFVIEYTVFGKSESALHFFATEKELGIVIWLLEHGANPDGIADDETPLHAAAQLGHLDVVHVLVNAGAEINATDFLEETPLHKASAGGYTDVIKFLLEKGADPTISEMCGELPVDQALPRKVEQIKEIFNQYCRP